MSSRSNVEKAPEPAEALPITTVVADSLEAVERLRTSWKRLRSGCSLATPNADPDRYLAPLRGLGVRARPYVAMLHEGAEPRALIVGREQVRSGRIRLAYLQVPTLSLRSLDIVYGGLITDDSQQAVRAVVDHLRRLIDTGRFDQIMINHLPVRDRVAMALGADRALARRIVADVPYPAWRFALVPGSYERTIQRFSRKHRYNMRRTDRLLVDRFVGDVVLHRFEKPAQIEELAAGAAQTTACTDQAALGAGAVDTTLHRALCEAKIGWIDYGFGDSPYKRIFYVTESWNEATVHLDAKTVRASSTRIVHRLAVGPNRRVSDVAARCGVLTQVKKCRRGRLAGRRKSPTASRGWK